MNNLMNRKKNQKGFTLMEMLIVVAIIAVMVAILIPTVSKSLNKSKEGTDISNLRTMYSEAQQDYLSQGVPDKITFDVPKLNFAQKGDETQSGYIGGFLAADSTGTSSDEKGKVEDLSVADGANNWAERTSLYYAKDTDKTYQITVGKNGCFESKDEYQSEAWIDDPDASASASGSGS